MNNYAYRLICFGLRMQMKLPLADILPMFHHSLPLQLHFPLNFPKRQETSQTCYPTFCETPQRVQEAVTSHVVRCRSQVEIASLGFSFHFIRIYFGKIFIVGKCFVV